MKINLGSKVLFKNGLLTVGLLYIVPAIFATIFSGSKIVLIKLTSDIIENPIFVLVQILVICITILNYGDLYSYQIRRHNKILVNFITVFCIWIVLFCSCSLTAGIENAIQDGWDGFKSTIFNWVGYLLIIFFFLAVINFLLIGFTMGNKILKVNENFNLK